MENFAAVEGSCVLCRVAGSTYAVRSEDIAHLEMVGAITPVPNSPPFVDGVTSVRGRVVPVINMRARFGFERQPVDLRARLIVARSHGRTVGLLVDEAREFAAIPETAIQSPPTGLSEMSTRYLRGTTHIGDRLILVLDVAELIRVAAESDLEGPPLLSA